MQKTKIDWSEIKCKVNALQESLDRKNILPPEEKHILLKARAQALAVETKDEAAQKESVEIVVFSLASETYGIGSTFIREVYPLKDFATLPGTPAFVLGIVNVRGQIISVIDLKKFFNLPEKGLGELNKVIIIRNERMEFGILADEIFGIRNIVLSGLQQELPILNRMKDEYIKGITNDRLIVLDVEELLTDKDIIVNEEVIL